jgi:hypothetical protein
LRVPGTWNRKNQRNGAEPKRTLLIACNRRLRYPLARFEPLAETSPTAEKRRQIAAIPLPQPRKLTGAKQDQLEDRIASCVIAPVGLRSPADFALCCFAVRSGVAREEVWRRVSGIGKFAERGEAYFNTTWDSAENAVRTEKVTHLQRSIERQAAPCVDDDDEDYDFGGGGLPSSAGEPDQPRRPTITICPSTLVFTTMQAITGRLLATQSCYSRADQLVVTREASIRPILGAAELAGLLNQYVEFYFADDEGGEYKPLPPAFGNTWLNQADERARLPRIALYSHNPVYTEDWRLVAPGYDAQSEIYYAGPEIEVRPDTEHLDRLLREFCFQTPGDRTNYIGMLLTALLVPRFIGAKPAVLLSGNQAGLGKSVLAQIVAILRDGHPVETASYNPNDEEFEKRLGSIVHRGVTTLVIDNAKSSGRNPRIESACLERSITDPILSFRLLGHSRDIRVENSHLFCLTANTPEISRDLVTRSVVVNLYHEGDPARRTFDMADPEEYAQTHRLELWGELVGMVERWKAAGSPLAQTHNRFNKRGWGDIVGGILEACGEPDFLANAELAALELDDTRQQFAELVTLLARHEQGVWTAAELACLAAGQQLLVDELGDGTPRSKATRMGKIAGRYVNDPFELSDDAQAFLRRSGDRKGTTYRLEVSTPPHGAERGDVCRTSAERVISNVRHT